MYIYDGEHANTQTVIPSLFPGGAQLRRWVTGTARRELVPRCSHQVFTQVFAKKSHVEAIALRLEAVAR